MEFQVKIIKSGKTDPANWVGKDITCAHCECQFEIEDETEIIREDNPGTILLGVECPGCDEHFYIHQISL